MRLCSVSYCPTSSFSWFISFLFWFVVRGSVFYIFQTTKRKRLRTRKERNKRRKRQQHQRQQESQQKLQRESKERSNDSSREISPVKSGKHEFSSKCSTVSGRILYTNRKPRVKSPLECVTPTLITRTNDYLSDLTYSYVQAGLIDASSKDNIQSPPCEKCNPSYYMHYENNGYDNSLLDLHQIKNNQHANYSLFGKFLTL